MVIIKCKAILKNTFKTLFLLLFIISTTSEVYAQERYERFGGSDRYETSVKISQGFSDKSEYAILVSGENFPDALCASPLSKKYNAPIILTPEKKLDDRTAQQLKNLGTTRVLIIGQSISKDVEDSLSNMGMEYVRIGGKDRYETAVSVANYVGIKDKIFLVSGEGYPDALSIAPIAASMDVPIILVSRDYVPDSVKEALSDKNIEYSYIIGSEGAISENVKSQFKNAERISGQDRYDTNLAVINRFRDALNMENVYLASALDFPDSLSGAALAQKNRSPLILVSEYINENQQNNIKELLSSANNTYVLGLEGAVSLKSLYLVGLEDKLPEPPKPESPKPTGPQPPEWTSSFNVMNAGETERVYIKGAPSAYSSNIASTYGSLSEVKILDSKNGYYYVEILDYDTLNYVKGYVAMSRVKTVTPTGPYNILVDKSKQRVYVFNGQTLEKEFICSTGRDETPTPSGRFLVGSKGEEFDASRYSKCYFWTRLDNNYLFHSAIYNLNGYVVESEYEKLGSKASHGCIRLPYYDAKWIYDNVPYGTLVTIID